MPLLADAFAPKLLPHDEMRAMSLLPISFLMLFTPHISTYFLSASRNLKSLGTPASSSEQAELFLTAAPMAQQLQSSSTQVLLFHLFFHLSHFQAFRGRGEIQRNKNRGWIGVKTKQTVQLLLLSAGSPSTAMQRMFSQPTLDGLFSFNFFSSFSQFQELIRLHFICISTITCVCWHTPSVQCPGASLQCCWIPLTWHHNQALMDSGGSQMLLFQDCFPY